MAALQSRARTQHQQQQAEESEQHGIQHVRTSRHSPQRTEGGAGQTGEEEAWVLFAPQPPKSASTARNRAIPPQAEGDDDDDVDPFEQQQQQQQEDHSEHTLSTSSSVAWQLVAPGSGSSSTLGQLNPAITGRTRSPHHQQQQLEGQDDGEEVDADADEIELDIGNSLSRWSAVPVPRRDTSSFFDDEDEEDALFSDKLDSHRDEEDRRRQKLHKDRLFDDSRATSSLQESIYPDLPALRSAKSRQQRQDGEDTDMLSLPSSLSVSDRSSSHDLPSPRFDYTDIEHDALEHAIVHEQGSSNITLTEAALSRIPTANNITASGEAEVALTSGSEDELDDHDEALLSRAPDAISAGIRPSRRRALQSVRPSSQLSSAVSGGRVSSSQRSATKRRHRQSGVSDKGSKRSNTSASLLTAPDMRPPVPLAKTHQQKAGPHSMQQERQVSPTRSKAARFSQLARQAARDIFSVDEEVMNMMSQPGSVFDQARPTMRLRSDSAQHGLSAFSAHLAGELGDGPGTRGLFTSLYDEEQSIDSGDETETESHVQNYARRSRRRSSLFADNDKQRYTLYREPPQEQQDELRASLTAEQLHTASLGLHRSFSLAGIQHFLIDSVYNSLSSSMLGTPRSQSGSLSPSHIQANSFMSARRRTHSAPSVERSHSSGDLYAQANQSEQQAEIREFKVAVSYWRRVLRSFNF